MAELGANVALVQAIVCYNERADALFGHSEQPKQFPFTPLIGLRFACDILFAGNCYFSARKGVYLHVLSATSNRRQPINLSDTATALHAIPANTATALHAIPANTVSTATIRATSKSALSSPAVVLVSDSSRCQCTKHGSYCRALRCWRVWSCQVFRILMYKWRIFDLSHIRMCITDFVNPLNPLCDLCIAMGSEA
jgi:hypothetical protein